MIDPADAPRVAVYGLWHLGSVVAACLAHAGRPTVGLDPDPERVRELAAGRPPVREPDLDQRIAAGLRSGGLRFTSSAQEALAGAGVLWIAFDTPVDERDEPDVAWLRARLAEVKAAVEPGTLVIVSSQVPVGFTAELEREWAGRGLRFACAPENLRLGTAVASFERPERVVVGVRDEADRPAIESLFAPFCTRIEWMSPESAELTKHALNALLASSVGFINELARLCEAAGADVKDVERGLKSDARIGLRPYLSAGGPFSGGTLARDLRALAAAGRRLGVATPLLEGVLASNDHHRAWLLERVRRALHGAESPVAALLGLTYKAGTDTLRRSAAIELALTLERDGVAVRAHDPAVRALPAELASRLRLCPTAGDALAGADVAVLATDWPEYRALTAQDFVSRMRRACVVDQTWGLREALAADARVVYLAPGRGSAGGAA